MSSTPNAGNTQIRSGLKFWGVSLLVIAAVLFFATRQPQHPLMGEPAPDIALEMLGGSTFHLEEYRAGGILILDFWATWCGPCRTSMPIIEAVAEEYEARGVKLVCINEAESASAASAFLNDMGLECEVALDSRMEAGRAYMATGLPQTVLVGRSGIIEAVYVGWGPGSEQRMRHDLDRLLAGDSS